MNSYELSRKWFDWCFENPDKISPNHSALYFFCIEHCNRLGWKEKFGLPTTMAKEAIGIRSYNTYINTLNDLVDFGFIKMIEKSKNQYSSNIVALSNFDNTLNKALDKALIKHVTKQCESTGESICSIDKQVTNNKEQQTTIKKFQPPTVLEVESYFVENGYTKEAGKRAFNYYTAGNWHDSKGHPVKNWKQKMQAVWFKPENKIIDQLQPEPYVKPKFVY